MLKLGDEAKTTTPEELLDVTKKESAMWKALIEQLGIKGD